MGLDMYLTKETFIGGFYKHRNVEGDITILQNGKQVSIHLERVETIVEQVGCWCKANAIHNWFVENVQKGIDDCGKYAVSKDDMKNLLAVCKKVISNSNLINGVIHNGMVLTKDKGWQNIFETGKIVENSKVAKELLPSVEGDFFGSTDYDEWYIDDIKKTIKILETALSEDGDFYYQSSW